jgi:hypothetical protein
MIHTEFVAIFLSAFYQKDLIDYINIFTKLKKSTGTNSGTVIFSLIELVLAVDC